MPSGTAKQRLAGEQQHTREMSTSSISLPLGTKALAKSLMAWTMLTSFRGVKKKKRQSEDALGQICFKRYLKTLNTLTSAFLSLITAAHRLLGGKSRSTEYQETAPLNLRVEISTIPIIPGCREILLMVHKSFGNRLLLPGTSDSLLIISSN